MKDFFKSLFTNKKRLAIFIILILAAGYFIYRHYSAKASPVSYLTAQASDQTIISSVSGTGQVSEDRDVDITPQTSGQLTAVDVTQGQQVKAGQTIAVVDETNNTIALNQARASVASAQANYDQVLAGSTSQAIELAQLAVAADQEAVTTASTSLQTTKQQDATNVANALTNLLNSSPSAMASNTNIGTGTVNITGNYTGTQQGTYTIQIYSTGSGKQFDYTGLESGTGVISSVPQPLGTKGLYVAFTGQPIDTDTWTVSIPNTLASNYTANYNAYQTALTSQANDITTAQNQIVSAQNKLQQDEVNLQVQQQPPTNQAVESAKASLIQAQAQLQDAQITYNNNILKAPFDGEVAQLNNQVGDQVSASTDVAVMVTNQSVAIIPLNEVDVANVQLGDKVSMTFDAVTNLTITGTVVEIDNIGTVSQGVVSYNVKITFDTEDPRVKSGMSVSASIITNIAADVLSVPSTAIQIQGTNSYVEVLTSGDTTPAVSGQGVTSKVAPTNVVVQTGVTDDTNTQITGGNLKVGDTVVTQTINPTATKSAASSATSALRLGGGGGGFGGGGGGGAVRVTTGAAGAR